MIKHIVFWKLKEEAVGQTRDQNKLQMKSMLLDLVGKVPGILALEVGFNVYSGDMCADIALYTEFASLADLDAYQVHPDHLLVVDFVKQVVSERRVMDYEVSL